MAEMRNRARLGGKKLAISVLFDTVKLEIICGDDYEALVLYEDLLERLRSGQNVSIGLDQPEEQTKEASRRSP